MQNARIGSPIHNDRSFDLSESDHIDASRSDQNRYISICPDVSFQENERIVYQKLFGPWMEDRNQRNHKARHPERVVTADSMLKNKQTRPEEVILQIGNMDQYPDPQVLMDCFNEWQNEIKKTMGRRCLILDAALHMDESTPHIHVRRTWLYRDRDDGLMKIGQDKALEYAGIPLPHPDKPVGRYNNRKMVFTSMMREKWQDICAEHGIEVDRTPGHEKHLDRHAYIRQQVMAERERAEQEREKRRRTSEEMR